MWRLDGKSEAGASILWMSNLLTTAALVKAAGQKALLVEVEGSLVVLLL